MRFPKALPLLLLLPSSLAAQDLSNSPRRFHVTPTAGYLSYGAYFNGPGGLSFSNQNGAAYGGQVDVTVWRNLSLVGSVLHATSDWSFQGVPLIGSVNVGGANLWLYDAGLRLQFPLGATRTVAPFVEAGAGAIRYAVDNVLLTGHATNFAVTGGVGILARLNDRLSLEAKVKDHAASFRSVDQASAFGVTGRWAHTVGFLVGVGVGL
jgi:Outer membrane protein beta-barrel domain